MRKINFLIIGILFLLVILPFVSSFQTNLTEAKALVKGDTYVISAYPTSNENGSDLYIWYGNTPPQNAYTYIWYNLSSLGTISEVTNATAYFYQYTIYGTPNRIVYYCNNYFNESNLTWNNQGTEINNCNLSNYKILTQYSGFYFGVDITDWVENDADKIFTLKIIDTNYQTSARFYSRDYVIGGNVPYLNVTYLIQDLEVNMTPLDQSVYLANQTINLTCNFTDSINMTNLGLDIGGIQNQSAFAGNTSYILNASVSFPINGIYNWSCEAMDYDLNYIYETYFLNIGNYTINEVIYNNQTYETKSETYSLNISSDSSASATLYYDGTAYGTSKTTNGNQSLFTTTLDVPITGSNLSFYWAITTDGITYQTQNYYQSVSPIVLTECEGVYNVSYINFTFADELNSSALNGSINSLLTEYYLGSGAVTKTFVFSNLTIKQSHALCFSPSNEIMKHDGMQITYSNLPNYPIRNYLESAGALTNSTTNRTLYLLNINSGQYVIFQVLDQMNAQVIGAYVNVENLFGVSVCSGYTDSAGSITCWLNPVQPVNVYASATGYTSGSLSITPSYTTYTIILTQISTPEIYCYSGIDYHIAPNGDLQNNTIYNFQFNITANSNLDSYGFYLYDENNSLLCSMSDTIITGGNLSCPVNILANKNITMNYYWEINGTICDGNYIWYSWNQYQGDTSIATFFEDLKLFVNRPEFGGNGGFTLMIFFFFIILITTCMICYVSGMYSITAIGGIIVAETSLFYLFNIFPLVPTVIIIAIYIGYLIWENAR